MEQTIPQNGFVKQHVFRCSYTVDVCIPVFMLFQKKYFWGNSKRFEFIRLSLGQALFKARIFGLFLGPPVFPGISHHMVVPQSACLDVTW